MQPVLYESHCHTPLCRHAVGEPEDYAAAALKRNLAGITITCHGPAPQNWGHCMQSHEWPSYLEMCRRAAEKFAGQIDVKTGIECDYIPGMESYWAEFLARQPLSHVLGSVHPQVGEYRTAYWKGDPLEFQKTYFEHLAVAAETGLFHTLSHPDLVKNCLPRQWDIDRVMPAIQRALDRIARTTTAMELNTSGVNKEIPEYNPAPAILREMALRKIPVVLGSDAHDPKRVADAFEPALDLLASCGFEAVTFFVDGIRRDVSVTVAKETLVGASDTPRLQ